MFIIVLACNCYAEGITSCDNNGTCTCKDNFKNEKCDACASGFINFPFCHDTNTGESG